MAGVMTSRLRCTMAMWEAPSWGWQRLQMAGSSGQESSGPTCVEKGRCSGYGNYACREGLCPVPG